MALTRKWKLGAKLFLALFLLFPGFGFAKDVYTIRLTGQVEPGLQAYI